MRILAVDPGEKRIGLAISDPTGLLARPLGVLKHISRPVDAAEIARIADEQGAERIVVGQSLNLEGSPTLQSRRAGHLADEIRLQSALPVELWDESFSTQDAQALQLELGTRRKQRKGHQDDLAAAIILQTYMDSHQPPERSG